MLCAGTPPYVLPSIFVLRSPQRYCQRFPIINVTIQTTRFTATHQELLPYVSRPLKIRIYANHLITILQLSFSAALDAEEAKCNGDQSIYRTAKKFCCTAEGCAL
jgi:hypothetical protein